MREIDIVPPLTRRQMLRSAGAGFGILGLAGALQAAGLLQPAQAADDRGDGRGPHFAPRAKRVIFLIMNGAPSHVDTFDPKAPTAGRRS